MMRAILLSSRLRIPCPETARLLNSRIFTRRLATQQSNRNPNDSVQWINRKQNIPVAPRRHAPPTQHGRTTSNQRAPDRIVIYHGGTGRTFYIGILRLTTIFVFGVTTFIIAPSISDDEHPWYIGAAVALGSVLPLIFVSYTAAPFVNFIQLELPIFARRSRLEAIQFAKNLPPTAKLSISTTGPSLIPRQTEVRLKDLVPDKSSLRPVSFRNKNPVPLSWSQGRTLQQFYTADKVKTGGSSSKYFPGVWEHVYKQIQSQRSSR